METLREKLEQSSRFLIGTELVSVRGSMAERSAVKARAFANQLVDSPLVDWISITDNAGGNPQLAPTALGKPILYAGKEVVIHLTCKDLNRNGLESEAWLLHSEGFNNVLAMTGDYPIAGAGGSAKPVFDIDSVGLISLLEKMNRGLARGGEKAEASRLERTQFTIGAVTTNFKLREGEVMPQYAKLAAKVSAGARFIINQIGFDARKKHELAVYMREHGMSHVPVIGNVYLLSGRVAQLFHEGKIPGVVVSRELNEVCQRQAKASDGGKAFFAELAAKQIAIYRGLGFRGAYLGGVHNFAALENILRIETSFGPNDWKEFAKEISFSRAGEFFFYAPDVESGLILPGVRANDPAAGGGRASLRYAISKWTHETMFTPGTALSRLGAKVCANAKDPWQGPKWMRAVEHLSKAVLFSCRDCGDCSLPEIAYLCPESQCAKNQRNGPCGGTRDGRCEVDGYGDCIWLRAYERLKHDGKEGALVEHAPVIQDQGLRGTSSWANTWLARDHFAKKATDEAPTSPAPQPVTSHSK